jgi:lipopolysaccharide biosynthesis glycosyltransferase
LLAASQSNTHRLIIDSGEWGVEVGEAVFLGHEISMPAYVPITAWLRHGPFAMWLVKAARPKRIVELGSHYGFSYFAFCQAVKETGLATECFAVDTWQGDEHAGFYGEDVFAAVQVENAKYESFSTLLRNTFAEALDDIEDGSVDLLHIDGRHFYNDVKEDFESWIPKLSRNAIVLFHDTEVRQRDFGVWKYWAELTEKRAGFNFPYQHGLGVLFWGDDLSSELAEFRRATETEFGRQALTATFYTSGAALSRNIEFEERIEHLDAERSKLSNEISQLTDAMAARQAEYLRAAEDSHAERTTLSSEISRLVDELAASQAGCLRATEDFSAERAKLSNELSRLSSENEALRHDLAYARSRSHRVWKDYIAYKLLKKLASSQLPIGERTRARFIRSAQKRDPKRSLDSGAGNASSSQPVAVASIPVKLEDSAIDSKRTVDPADVGYLATKLEVLHSGFWDERWYLKHYFREYIAWRAGHAANNSPIDHYLQVGWKAGYRPSSNFVVHRASNSGQIEPISKFLTGIRPEFHFDENIWLPERRVITAYLDKKGTRTSRKVVYCCIINGYDSLVQPYHIDPEWDYICFTDDARLIENGTKGVWEIRAALHPELRPDRRNRFHKMLPHRLFPDHDESIYIDGNVNLISSYLFDEVRSRKLPLLLPLHFSRVCIYKEIEVLLGSKRTSDENRRMLPDQMDFLKQMGFPEGYGLTENSVIYRRHHDETVRRIMENWWNLLCSFSARDQSTLSYVLWKESISPYDISFPNIRFLNSDFWVFQHQGEISKAPPISVDVKISPSFETDYVPIVLSCNESFIGYLGVVLTSLIDNASDDRNYDIIILESDVSDASKARISALGKRNVSVRFYNMQSIVAQLNDFDIHVEGYVPAETYNKIFLKEIMDGYEKIIYIDTDIVIRSDIAELYDTELFGKAMGASRNIANIHAARANTEIRGRKFGEYLKNELGIDRSDHYFQAGIIILDMTSQKAEDLLRLSLEKLKQIKQPVFFDQCIFNSIFYGDVHFFSTRWNYVWYMQNYSYLKSTLNDDLFFDYAKSRLDPKIVHYASKDKPTNKFDWRLSSYFWRYLRSSPFADSLIAQLEEKKATSDFAVPSLDRLCSEPAPRVLVHLHAFYHDQLEYMFGKLDNIEGAQWDLVVTASENADAVQDAVRRRFKNAEVLKVKNQGFDLYPFLKVLQSKNLSHYDYVLKLHTKHPRPESPDSKVYGLPVPGHKWRDDLVDALLGSKGTFTKNLSRFRAVPTLGSVAAGQYIFSINENREKTTYNLRHWMNRFRIEAGEHYVGGTMFMARAYPFERLKAINPDELDFASGDGPSGSHKNLAHVFERLLGLVVETEGLSIGGAPNSPVRALRVITESRSAGARATA